MNKIFLEFQRPFWPQNCSGYSLIWSNIESVPSKSWYHGVFGFYTLPFVPNVLCGWISGVEARQMELLCDDEVKKKCVELLERFTGKKDLPPVVSFCRYVRIVLC